jgi:hypothetical protein
VKTGVVGLPLHTGSAPPWLFKRMVRMAGNVAEALVYDYGEEEFLRRIADPYWFQALACILGFDCTLQAPRQLPPALLRSLFLRKGMALP